MYALIDAVGESTIGQVTVKEQSDRLGELFRRVDSRVRRFDHGVDPAQVDQALALLRHVRDELSVIAYDLDDLADASRKQVEALQERAMALATFPAATVLAPLPRLARDLCRELSKQAELVVDDGDVELDKQVLERIAEPLRALVINALDHAHHLHQKFVAADRELAGEHLDGGRLCRVEVAVGHLPRLLPVHELEDLDPGACPCEVVLDPGEVGDATPGRGLGVAGPLAHLLDEAQRRPGRERQRSRRQWLRLVPA